MALEPIGDIGSGVLAPELNLIDSATASRHSGRLFQIAHEFAPFFQLGAIVTGNAGFFADILKLFQQFLFQAKKNELKLIIEHKV